MKHKIFALLGVLAIIWIIVPAEGVAAPLQPPPNPGSSLQPTVDTQTIALPLMLRATVRIPIPAGSFDMGCDLGSPLGYLCEYDEISLHTVYLDAYVIDATEVTNARYARCVAAGACTPPYNTSSWVILNYYGNSAYANYPVVWVDWSQADAYCTWRGGHLPTEAQWEKAARGSTDQRYFPWGDTLPDCTLANFGNEVCVENTTAVGSYPLGKSPYGLFDVAGNVWEWVNDWYQFDYYDESPAENPTGPLTGEYRVLRGGSWATTLNHVRVTGRWFTSQPTIYYIGFRCAYPAGK